MTEMTDGEKREWLEIFSIKHDLLIATLEKQSIHLEFIASNLNILLKHTLQK